MNQAPPGWYPDPWDQGFVRYRDGSSWTASVSPLGLAPTRAMVLAWLDGGDPPPAGRCLTYRETQWSYRRPNSYQLLDELDRPVGDLLPVDPPSLGGAVLWIGQ